MSILDKIIYDKKREVALKKSLVPIKQLSIYQLFEAKTNSLTAALLNSDFGIIAEHKRRSPSKATINQSLSVDQVVKGYEDAGACGISVLTDSKYFGGSLDDLILAKASTSIPLLRKEFIIDEYQILEAKAHGADAILLIASVLTHFEIKTFSEFAKSIGLEVLIEIHSLDELAKSLLSSIDIIGINNRNLSTFEVDICTSKRLADFIPKEFVKISESGINSSRDILDLKSYGYQGFLIGENFMKTDNPGKAADDFLREITNNKIST